MAFHLAIHMSILCRFIENSFRAEKNGTGQTENSTHTFIVETNKRGSVGNFTKKEREC